MEPKSDSFAVMTYNILVGGESLLGARSRIDAIEAVIRANQPDVLGVQEANDPEAFFDLAHRLGMQAILGYSRSGYHVGLMSRWPIRHWTNYGRPIFQKGLIEAEIDLPGEPQPWHIFVGHLTADFSRGYLAERQRKAELQTFLDCMAHVREQGRPHALLGDFNALAPGESFDIVQLLRRVTENDDEARAAGERREGYPRLSYVIPPALRPLLPLIRQIPSSPLLAGLAAAAANLLVPRSAIRILQNAGYVECLQLQYPDLRSIPPTCPLPRPAGRIDYIWADPHLATRITHV